MIVSVTSCERKSRKSDNSPIAVAVDAQQPTTQKPPDEVAEYVRNRVAEGFASREEIIEYAVDLFSDEISSDILKRNVPRLTDQALAGHRERELKWTQITDCDRIDEPSQKARNSGFGGNSNRLVF